ncbi:MAG: cobalamin biosynthesis protein CobW [Hyphomicrobiales bacterium]|nr:cobalamin biosynthesis protein CobW [Hyphomicrobiales bacterium]MCY4032615.1 cobalamin biosynthesis protein CobW [Hyphomicrobiales bacterium]MCY4039480.1 cobalamin biosynthesis protein CobW [Hyphomicrobiales bacterium]
MEKIPVTIITGFLGAGKTTLTRHLLSSCAGKRIAVVVNEFGDMGVDGDLLRACGIEGCGDEDIVELANGCICCTVADDFLPVMRKLLAREDAPEHILIETSGLALPKPLVSAFLWPEVRTRCSVDGVIAVVDADAVASGRFAADVGALEQQRLADESLDHETPLEELFEEQVGCADILLLNKVDLLEEDALESVREQCASHLRPQARMVEASQGEVDARIVLGLEVAAEEDLDSRPSHHDGEEEHDHDDFESVVLEFGEFASVEDVLESVGRLLRAQEVLRVKGFVSVAGRSMRLVIQAVGPRVEHYFGGEWGANEERATRLVVIGEVGLDADLLRGAFLGVPH